jgi:hypothetical protein
LAFRHTSASRRPDFSRPVTVSVPDSVGDSLQDFSAGPGKKIMSREEKKNRPQEKIRENADMNI